MKRVVSIAVLASAAIGSVGVSQAAELRAGVYKYDGGSALYALQDSQHFICDDCPRVPSLMLASAVIDNGFIVRQESPPTSENQQAESPPTVAVLNGPFAEVFFSLNQAKVVQEERSRLKERLASLEPGVPVVVEGYACKLGSRAYNMKLSMRRAKAVAAYIESLGVKVSKVSWYGEGKQESGPLDKNRKAIIQVRERNFANEDIR